MEKCVQGWKRLCDEPVGLWYSPGAFLAYYNLDHCSDESCHHRRLNKRKRARLPFCSISDEEGPGGQFDTGASPVHAAEKRLFGKSVQ